MHLNFHWQASLVMLTISSFVQCARLFSSNSVENDASLVNISGSWKFESLDDRPNIQPDELYELGGYLQFSHVKYFEFRFVENPLDFLNNFWSQQLEQIKKVRESEKERGQQTGSSFPNPFQSITLSFDYWTKRISNQTTDNKEIKCNLTMSICNESYQETMTPSLWMYAAVRLNLELFNFSNQDQLLKCISNIFAEVECFQVDTLTHQSQSTEIDSLAIKNVQVMFEYMNLNDDEDDYDSGIEKSMNESFPTNATSLRSIKKKFRKMLRKKGKKLLRDMILLKSSESKMRSNHQFDLIFDCHYRECSTFKFNRQSVPISSWQGVQWAPFVTNQLEKYVGTDQNNSTLIMSFNFLNLNTKCVAFQYYVSTFSSIHIWLPDSRSPVFILYPTIKSNNQDESNLALDWYYDEICFADILTPDSVLQARQHSSSNKSYKLIFTAQQPQSGGYVAIGSIKIIEDLLRPALDYDRQILTGWSVDGAAAAEQWTISPADPKYFQPQLSADKRLEITITKPQLLGSSEVGLLSNWFVRVPQQVLRFELKSNFSYGMLEAQLLDTNYTIKWSTGRVRMWPNEKHRYVFNLDQICNQSEHTIKNNCVQYERHLRWRLLITYTNSHEPIPESESVQISSLDQSDACAEPDACLNSATCRSTGVNKKKCDCLFGYHGERCEYRNQCVFPFPGQKSGSEQCEEMKAFDCIPIGSYFRCECMPPLNSTFFDNIDEQFNMYIWSNSLSKCISVSSCSRTQCEDSLQHCVEINDQAQCECSYGYQPIESQGHIKCVPNDPCLDSEQKCPLNARCVDLTGGVSSQQHSLMYLCYCDPLDGMQKVASDNQFGFECHPTLNNPFVKQAYNCYMNYEVLPPIDNSNRSKRWILGGKDEDSYDFTREDSTSGYSNDISSVKPNLNLQLQNVQNGQSNNVKCTCAQGYNISQICVASNELLEKGCRPACSSTEFCVQSLESNKSLVSKPHCECQLGFYGENCEQSVCDSKTNASSLVQQMCGRLGCQVGISSLQLNWFACNCQAASSHSIHFESNQTDESIASLHQISGYHTNPVTGLCEQQEICAPGSIEKEACDKVGGVCLPRLFETDGSLVSNCVCPFGFRWHSTRHRCVPLCSLDTRCAPLNARCQTIPSKNSTQCICPIGRKWDLLRAACVFGDKRNRVYELQVEFQLINNHNEQTFFEQAANSMLAIDCQSNLDVKGCAKQIQKARQRLVFMFNQLPTIELLDSQVSDAWLESLKAIFAGDVVHVTPVEIEWKQVEQNQKRKQTVFAYKDERDVIVDSNALVANKSQNPTELSSPFASIFYRTIRARLLVDTGGLVNWIDNSWLNRSCYSLTENASQTNFCALPPTILVRAESVRLQQLNLCEQAQRLHLCPDHTTVQCSANTNRFGCDCKPGFVSVLQIPQEVNGDLMINYCNDIDECEQISTNDCNQTSSVCVNLPGTYRCDCRTGFKQINVSLCVDLCEGVDCGNGLCVKGSDQLNYYCACPKNWTGPKCQFAIGISNNVITYTGSTVLIILLITVAILSGKLCQDS